MFTHRLDIALASKDPTPGAFPVRVSLKQEKPPQKRGLLSSLAPGKKERLKFVWGLR